MPLFLYGENMGLSRTQEVVLMNMGIDMSIIIYYPIIDKAILKYDNQETQSINVGTFKKLLKDNMITKTGQDPLTDLGMMEFYDLTDNGVHFCKGIS